MIEFLLIVLIIGLAVNLYFTYQNYVKQTGNDAEFQDLIELFNEELNQIEKTIKTESLQNRELESSYAKQAREELHNTIKRFEDSLMKRFFENAGLQKNQLETFANRLDYLTRSNETRFDKMREQVGVSLKDIQIENSKKLDEMRVTVDEKLQNALEKRLGESFHQVSKRLEMVYQGLGEMKNLAKGVGDLKQVLTNVKTKGIIGEYQLENILKQLLTTGQYGKNVKTKPGSNVFVEFAIKLPGKNNADNPVWLPVDAKFPTEDYQVMVDAEEKSDLQLLKKAQREIMKKMKIFAADISKKYIDPPNTTDFAIMFLPIEGLYAEVLRQPGLFETLQRQYHVIVTGPATLSAILNSLQMGFRSLAIEKRSDEIGKTLSAVKTEFAKFGTILDKTRKKIQEAGNIIDQADVRTRSIKRKLKHVELMPEEETKHFFITNEK